MNGPSVIAEGMTRAAALAAVRRAFKDAGLDTAALDARLLLLHALGTDAADLAARPESTLARDVTVRLQDFLCRRLRHEPVARILGEREFWGLRFVLSPETLVPRPDTETVVATALALLPDRTAPLSILDLGTGSGCLLVALLFERPQASGLGVDRSFGAAVTAKANAERNGVGARASFAVTDWGAGLKGGFDLIVSNPPYIRSPVLATLDAEVRDFDPPAALDGGADGLDAYRTILSEAGQLLAPQGVLALEIGYDQKDDLARLAADRALDVLTVAPDLEGNPRCVALKRHSAK
jgi:release factor glutamine methyltransferase